METTYMCIVEIHRLYEILLPDGIPLEEVASLCQTSLLAMLFFPDVKRNSSVYLCGSFTKFYEYLKSYILE